MYLDVHVLDFLSSSGERRDRASPIYIFFPCWYYCKIVRLEPKEQVSVKSKWCRYLIGACWDVCFPTLCCPSKLWRSCRTDMNGIFRSRTRQIITLFMLAIVIIIKWLGNLAAFFVLCFCSLFPYCYMTLTLHRLQKALRCKWANGQHHT